MAITGCRGRRICRLSPAPFSAWLAISIAGGWLRAGRRPEQGAALFGAILDWQDYTGAVRDTAGARGMTDAAATDGRAFASRSLRLDTLVRLRWLAVVGQLSAVLFVHFVLQFPLPT